MMTIDMHRKSPKQQGFTLIELMIAMLLGLLLSGALLTMLSQARRSFQQDEVFASMQDESRYAMRELTSDLSMAGYIGDILVPESITFDATLLTSMGDDCERASDDETFAYRLTDSTTGVDTTLMGLDNITTAVAVAQFACLDAAELVAGTDIVAVKHLAGAESTSLVEGDVVVRYNGTVGSLFVHPIAASFPLPYEDRIYTPAIYFIRNYTNTAGDGLPSLCRKVLVGGTTVNMTTECIAAGIENLQVEYGIDSNADGSVDSYINAPDGVPTEAEMELMEQTVSVKVYMLARTADVDRAYTNDKTYAFSNAAIPPPNDSFRRRVYTTTVSVPNVRNRMLTGL
jgi:type IV pilus assembly protein PilW